DQSLQRVRRQSVAQSACDRHRERRSGRADADIGATGDAQSTAHAMTVDDGDDRFGYGRKGAEHLVDALFIGHAIVSAAAAELCDISNRDEGTAAGAAQHEGAKVRIGVDLRTRLAEPVVHLEGHRIACLGPIEGDAQTASDYLGEYFVAHVCSSLPVPTDAEEVCGDCESIAYSSDSTL